jgi:hypothetical protein
VLCVPFLSEPPERRAGAAGDDWVLAGANFIEPLVEYSLGLLAIRADRLFPLPAIRAVVLRGKKAKTAKKSGPLRHAGPTGIEVTVGSAGPSTN